MSESLIVPLRILVADDNEVNQKVARIALTQLGHQVEFARNGVEVIEKWRNGDFDLILMDIKMPGIDGLTATQMIREVEHGGEWRIPIYAVTAHAMESDRERCVEVGMDGYISKPINLDELLDVLTSVDTSHALERQNRAPDVVEEESDEKPLFDLMPLRNLISGDEEQLKSLVGIFLETLDQNLQGMQEALEEGDASKIEFTAHKIKGSSGQIRASLISSTALELEMMGKEGKLDGAAQKVARIVAEYEQIRPQLEEFLAGG